MHNYYVRNNDSFGNRFINPIIKINENNSGNMFYVSDSVLELATHGRLSERGRE